MQNQDQNSNQTKTEITDEYKFKLLLTAAENVIDAGDEKYMTCGEELVDLLKQFKIGGESSPETKDSQTGTKQVDKSDSLASLESYINTNTRLVQLMIVCVNKLIEDSSFDSHSLSYLNSQLMHWQGLIWESVQSDGF